LKKIKKKEGHQRRLRKSDQESKENAGNVGCPGIQMKKLFQEERVVNLSIA
jgi:hypothetical protein